MRPRGGLIASRAGALALAAPVRRRDEAAAAAGHADPDADRHARGAGAPAPTPAPLWSALETRGRRLAVGITEPNPNLVSPSHDIPSRSRAGATRSASCIRRSTGSSSTGRRSSPPSDAPPDLDALNGGCLRDKLPCAAFAGVRDQLRGARRAPARGRLGGLRGGRRHAGVGGAARLGLRARRHGAAQPDAARRRAAPPTARLVARHARRGREEGATLRYWAPWNEPNHPYSSSPQRPRRAAPPSRASRRGPTSRSRGALRAARSRGARRPALRARRGRRRWSAGAPSPRPSASSSRRCPRGWCAAPRAWTQHAYIGGDGRARRRRGAGSRAKGCAAAGLDDRDGRRAPRARRRRAPAARPASCAAAAPCTAASSAGTRDPRVTAAVQYTLREDDLFPTGLVTTDLDRAYPALAEWQQWGMRARERPEDASARGRRCGGCAHVYLASPGGGDDGAP